MFLLALKNLFSEKSRLSICVGGVAFSVLLILILRGLYFGFDQRITRYLESISADLWIVQDGSGDMFHSVSLLPNEYKEKLSQIEEIESAERFLGRQMIFDWKDERVTTFIVGVDFEKNIAGPIKVVEGKEKPDSHEIIIDRVLSKNKKIHLGDSLNIANHNFKIVGISEGGNLLLYQYSFILQKDAEEIFEMKNLTNRFIVKVKNQDETDKVMQKIENNLPRTKAFKKSEFIKQNRKTVTESFLPIVSVIVLIGFLIGLIVIGLTIFNATIEKSRELGVLKALGASNFNLYTLVFWQALFFSILGFLVGLALTFAIQPVILYFTPSFLSYFRLEDFVLVFALSILMAISASWIPLKRLSKIDPALVFKA